MFSVVGLELTQKPSGPIIAAGDCFRSHNGRQPWRLEPPFMPRHIKVTGLSRNRTLAAGGDRRRVGPLPLTFDVTGTLATCHPTRYFILAADGRQQWSLACRRCLKRHSA